MCTIGPPRRPACRICFEETGELLSPCACRGSSGFVHEDCLTQWAVAQRSGSPGSPEAWSPFLQCGTCKQGYTGKAAVALAIAWAGTVEQVGCDVLRGARRYTDREVLECLEAFHNLARTLSGDDNEELFARPKYGSLKEFLLREEVRDAHKPDFEDALRLTLSAMKIAQKQFGVRSITFAGAVSCRADVLMHKINTHAGYEPGTGRTHRTVERRAEAVAEPEGLYRQVLDIVERIDANPRSGTPPALIKRHRIETTMALANLLTQTERYEEAAKLQKRSLESTSKLFGRDSEQAAVCMANLGNCLFSTNRRKEAVELIREATAIRERIYGSKHPNVAYMLMELSECLAGEKASAESRKAHRAEAVLHAKRAVDIATWTLGEYHETTQDYKEQLFRLNRPLLVMSFNGLLLVLCLVPPLGMCWLLTLAGRSFWRWLMGGGGP